LQLLRGYPIYSEGEVGWGTEVKRFLTLVNEVADPVALLPLSLSLFIYHYTDGGKYAITL